MNLQNSSAKRKAHRKAQRAQEPLTYRKTLAAKKKWLETILDTRKDYDAPVTKRKRLTKEQYRKMLRSK